MKFLPLVLAVFALALTGCGHSANLLQYPVRGAVMYYSWEVGPEAASTNVSIENPASNAVTAAITAIGSGVLESKLREKLDRAANPELMAHSISDGIQTASVNYLDARPVLTRDSSVTFFVETTLTTYGIGSTAGAATARVGARSRIISRRDGKVIWEKEEVTSVALRGSYAPIAPPPGISHGPLHTAAGIYTVADLMNMSDSELTRILRGAALSVGRAMGESLREDIAQ